ncbi:MAG TPA: GNAT family N-acetyltransferase [Gaiellaceae bacterium]
MLSNELREFATFPPLHLAADDGWAVVDDGRFHLRVAPDGRRATVCRLRGGAAALHAEVVSRAPAARVVWITEGAQEPELRALGCRDQDPPLTSYPTALAIDRPPPVVDGVDVRPVADAADARAAEEVFRRGWGVPRPPARLSGEWIASVDGEPVAWAGARAGPLGLFLTGGVTVPEARGRGAYRALVRARWDEAARRGTPALVVHAEEAARRVLERLGFERVTRIVELVSEPSR